jgi:hypothetical protein
MYIYAWSYMFLGIYLSYGLASTYEGKYQSLSFWAWLTLYSMMIQVPSIYLQATLFHSLWLHSFSLCMPGYNRTVCTSLSIVALFKIAKIWKHTRYPTPDEWIKKMCYTCTMEYYSPAFSYTSLSFRKSIQFSNYGRYLVTSLWSS